MLGIDERSPRSRAARTANRVLVLEPAHDALGIEPLLLTPGEHTLGSSSGNTFVLSAPGVAERHCLITVRGNAATAMAIDRRCWINNGPLSETRLRTGDRLVIGPVQFRVGEMSQASEPLPEVSALATVETSEISRNDAPLPSRREGRRRPTPNRSRPSKARRSSPTPKELDSERLTAPSELEVRIQQRLAATSQLVDSLLAIDVDDVETLPSSPIDTSHLVPEHRSEFVLKLLDSVHQRASELVGREQSIAAKERELAIERERIQTEREAASRAHSELADHREQARRQHEALERLRDELDGERRQIDRDRRDADARTRDSERLLRDAQAAAESFQQEARQREESLAQRERAASERDEAVFAREHQLDEREQEIVQRLDAAAQKERAAAGCARDAASREQAVAERESGVAHREQTAHTQEQSIQEREQRAAEWDRQLASRERELASRDAEFAHHQQLAADRERDVAEKSREAGERELAASVRESAVSEREQTLRSRDAALDERAESLSGREQELNGLREELAFRESEFAARVHSLSEREALLDQQARQLDEFRAQLATEKERLAAESDASCRQRDATRSDFDELWPMLDRGLRTLAREHRSVSDQKASLANAQHDCALWMEQRTAIEQEHQRIRAELDARLNQQNAQAEHQLSVDEQQRELKAQRSAIEAERLRVAERESALVGAQAAIDIQRAEIDELRTEVEFRTSELEADRERLRLEIGAERERLLGEREQLVRDAAAARAVAAPSEPKAEPNGTSEVSVEAESVDQTAAPEAALSEQWELCEDAWRGIREETWRIVAEEERLEQESDWLRAERDRLSQESAVCDRRLGELDAAATWLDDWSIDLVEAAESIDERSDELAHREQWLSELQADYEKKSAEFNDAALRLARHHTALEQQELDLSVRDAVLAARAETLDERARELDSLSEALAVERAGSGAAQGDSDETNVPRESAMIRSPEAPWNPDSPTFGAGDALDDVLDEGSETPDSSPLPWANEPAMDGTADRHAPPDDVADAEPASWAASLGQPLDLDSRSIYQPGAMDAAAEFRRLAGFDGRIPSHDVEEASESPAHRATLDERIADSDTDSNSAEAPPADFRLLDLSWFTAKQAAEDAAATQEGAEDAGAAERDSLGGSRLSDYGVVEDDRVAAFLRARDSAPMEPDVDRVDDVSEIAPDEANEAESPEESPEDERVRSLRSQLAAMFDVSPDVLRTRRNEDRSASDEEESYRPEVDGLDEESSDHAGNQNSPEASDGELDAAREDGGEAGATGINFGLLMSPRRTEHSESGSRERETATPAAEAPPVVRPATKERDVAVNDIEDENSVAAYMERLFARNRQQTGGYAETDLTAPPRKPEPAPAPRVSAAEEIVVPAYVPGMENDVVPPEEDATSRTPVDPIHRQNKDAVRAHLASLRQVANHSARTAIAQHSWKQFRVMVWLKAVLLVGSAALSICLLSDSLLGKLGLKAAGWSLAGISLIVAASFAHSFGEVRRSTRQQPKKARRGSDRVPDSAASAESDAAPTEGDVESSGEVPR